MQHLSTSLGVQMKGCFYHLSSNLWKRIQRLGLQQRYNNKEEFAIFLRMLAALAFVPPNNVIVYYEQLYDHIRSFNEDCDDVIEYFEDNYIGRFGRNSPRRASTFSIDLWNMFHMTFDEFPRTNNSVDGRHRSFQATVAACHPTFWKFLDVLKQEEALNRMSILQSLGGHPPPVSRKRYADNFPNLPALQYLRSVAHNLAF